MARSDDLNSDPRIGEGEKLLSVRRFADAYDILDQALTDDRRNPHINVLMGIACLYQDFLEDAEHFFRKAIELDLDNTEARSGLAFVLLRKDHAAEAAEELCDILRVRPYHPFARKRFKELKSAPSLEAYIANLHPSMFVALPAKQFFGSLKKIKIPSAVRRIAIGIILGCVLLLMFLFASRQGETPAWRLFDNAARKAPDPYFPSASILETDMGKSLSRAIRSAANPPEIFISDNEVSSLLTRARQLLLDEEYNEARYVVNRILASNADRISLHTAQQLDAFLKEPLPEKMYFNPRVDEVWDEGPLYRGVYVKWLTQVVRATNGVFLQVAPARADGNENDAIQVVVVEENAQVYPSGTRVEVFGDILGVDAVSDTEKVIYIDGKRLVRLERSR